MIDRSSPMRIFVRMSGGDAASASSEFHLEASRNRASGGRDHRQEIALAVDVTLIGQVLDRSEELELVIQREAAIPIQPVVTGPENAVIIVAPRNQLAAAAMREA